MRFERDIVGQPLNNHHCWVVDDDHGRVPGLLEWHRADDGWEGRVVPPLLDREDDRWRPREEWLPAEQLERA